MISCYIRLLSCTAFSSFVANLVLEISLGYFGLEPDTRLLALEWSRVLPESRNGRQEWIKSTGRPVHCMIYNECNFCSIEVHMSKRRPFSNTMMRKTKQKELQCLARRCLASSSSSWHSHQHIDGGTVQGVWIFSRHGDRSPGRCLMLAHRRNEEAAYWVSKLPYPDSTAAYQAYSQFFPLRVQASLAKLA